MSGGALIVRGNALHLPLPDESVSLICTSPPYHGLRSYRDGGEHYHGQIGSEATPQEFLEALWACMAEFWRVLRPDGSCFINLGDKRSGSGGHNNAGIVGPSAKSTLGNPHYGRRMAAQSADSPTSTRRNAPDRYNQAAFGRPKSKMMLPHRFAIGCEDGLADPEGKGWIMRQDIVWQKLNGLPESVVDRCRDSHEYLFHFVKEPRYFASVDEVREAHSLPPYTPAPTQAGHSNRGTSDGMNGKSLGMLGQNPLGKLPGSVWSLASEPLIVSDEVKAHYDLPDHFAAFPTELVRRIILGWSPSGICTVCGEGRRPVVAREVGNPGYSNDQRRRTSIGGGPPSGGDVSYGITGYACSCTPRTSHRGKRGDWKDGREVMPEHGSDDFGSSGNAVPRRPGGFGDKVPAPEKPMTEYHLDGWTPPPTRPAVVLDPFLGSGTTTMVARALGRIGVGTDLSADYCRLAQWRTFRSGGGAKAIRRTSQENQGTLL